MATQTIQFAFLAGQTVTVKLFADDGSDTVLATPTATEATNRTGIYTFTQTDRAAGNYLITVSATGINAEYSLPLTLDTATFWAVERANVTHISGDSTAADNLEAAADGTGYNLGGGAIVSASVTGAVGSVTGAVGSVSGAVGSVTGNVGGNVVGSVGSVTAAVTLPTIPTNWITSTGIAAAALNGKGDWLDTTTDRPQLSAIHGKLPTRAYLVGSDIDSGAVSSADRAAISDAFWDDLTAEHTEAGSFGLALQSPATAAALASLVTTVGVAGAGLTAIPTLTTQMTESYAADGVAPTAAQALFLIMQNVGEVSISGTTKTVKKLDGSTTAATYTLDSATDPTSSTRAS